MKRLMTILGAAVLMLNVGCAAEKKSGTDPVAADCARGVCDASTGVPPAPGGSGDVPPTPGGGEGYAGATVALTNVQNLSTMFYNSYPGSNVTNLQVNVDMNRTMDSFIISYVSNGRVTEAGLGTRFPDGTRENNQYNGWVTEGSSRVYKGFFQDKYGAIVVVIDKVLNGGDGTPAALVGGTIYFQNFGENPAYDSKCQSGDPRYGTCFLNQLMCWEIKAGPYDCRTFLVSNNVVMNSSSAPNGIGPSRTKSYLKLADFNGLSRAAANIPAP